MSFYESLCKGSFVGLDLNLYAHEAFEKRIAILDEHENDEGFVFVGEKKWLVDYIDSSNPDHISTYYHWVELQFSGNLGVSFTPEVFSSERDKNQEYIWRCTIEVGELFIKGVQITKETFELPGKLDLSVYGTRTEISPAHIVRLYEFLHDLEFVLGSNNFEEYLNEEFELIGLGVRSVDNPMFWEIDLVSKYGSELNIPLSNRQLLDF